MFKTRPDDTAGRTRFDPLMSDTCANCGASPADDEIPAPMAWTDYLREEHDLLSVGTIFIPLCGDCYAHADRLKESTHDLGMHGEDTAATVEADVREFLDGLDLDALRDEA